MSRSFPRSAWERMPDAPRFKSPEGARHSLCFILIFMSRPFRAQFIFATFSQGVALGWYVSPFQGKSPNTDCANSTTGFPRFPTALAAK